MENQLPQNLVVDYQLLAVLVAYWGTLQSTTPATDNGVRDGRYNCLVALPTLMGSTTLAPRA